MNIELGQDIEFNFMRDYLGSQEYEYRRGGVRNFLCLKPFPPIIAYITCHKKLTF